MAGTRATAEETAPAAVDWQSYTDLSLHSILEAALTEFQQHGYHGTTVRAIAARAGLTMPSLYYHFGSKEGIFAALLEVAMDDLQLHIEAGLAAADDTPTKFDNFVRSIVLHYVHRRGLAMLHHEYRFLGDEFRARYVVRREFVERTLEDILEAGIAEGLFIKDDTRFSTRVLLGMFGGILNWYREGGPLSAAEIADRYTRDAVRMVSRHSD